MRKMQLKRHVLECCSQSIAENNKNYTDASNIQPTETKQTPWY